MPAWPPTRWSISSRRCVWVATPTTDGRITVPHGSGLGIDPDPDPDVISAYRCDGD
ncbi:hypothetical protein [[Mycobacterium] holstebronense]|uniref:Enolase C-terminal domain-containing protein n=1 Tax=[Mycobacterium] holstebronense TaxID=3064288 RepID=A0ABN9NQQ5_9MYCO|nr:hypothetical protein [Mycolicibacter sp. MU0102]CAJ1510491.1 hypothetical protein MU0102_004202 [Mycolicibacter sp. MU0102]